MQKEVVIKRQVEFRPGEVEVTENYPPGSFGCLLFSPNVPWWMNIYEIEQLRSGLCRAVLKDPRFPERERLFTLGLEKETQVLNFGYLTDLGMERVQDDMWGGYRRAFRVPRQA